MICRATFTRKSTPKKWVRLAGFHFSKNGMLTQLRKITEGKGDAETMRALAAGLSGTEAEVSEIVSSLRAARDIMSSQRENLAFAHRLDNVLYGPVHHIVDANTDPRDGAGNIPDSSSTNSTICHLPRRAVSSCSI